MGSGIFVLTRLCTDSTLISTIHDLMVIHDSECVCASCVSCLTVAVLFSAASWHKTFLLFLLEILL